MSCGHYLSKTCRQDIGEVIHGRGIGNVSGIMQRYLTDEGTKVIGIIDNDKRQPSFFNSFETHVEEHGLLIKKHPDYLAYLIVIDPAFEKWLLSIMASNGLNLEHYQLPTESKALRQRTKSLEIETDSHFDRLLTDLSESDAFLLIKNFLQQV